MALIPVITRGKFESLDDTLKTLYKPVGDTFQLDIDETTINEHISVKDKNVPLVNELNEIKSKTENYKIQLEEKQNLVNEYVTKNNKRVLDDSLKRLTKDLDLSDGREELLIRLLSPKINSLLGDLDNQEVDEKVITKELSNELKELRKISSSTFVEKKDDGGGIRYEKQKGTITNDPKKESGSDSINYDNYNGSISTIDYDDYMNNYFNQEIE
jgi:hypothetical protein